MCVDSKVTIVVNATLEDEEQRSFFVFTAHLSLYPSSNEGKDAVWAGDSPYVPGQPIQYSDMAMVMAEEVLVVK